MTRLVFARILLVALGLLLGVAGAEIGLRLLPERPGFEDDRPAYFVGPPHISPFRERSEIPAKPPGVFRIFVLGDSFTWGANVQMNYTYPNLLEWLLNAKGPGAYEVYNFGMNGASTADELDLVEKLAVHQPDLFLLGYFLNDPAADPELAGEPNDTPSWLRAHSHLIDFLHRRLWARRLAASQLHYFRSLFDPGGSSWKAHRETVVRLARTRERLGVPLKMAIWPHLAFPLDERYPFRDIHQQIRGLFAEAHLEALDLLEVFWRRDSDRLQAVPRYDPHPSEIAHRLAAEALFEWLKKTEPVVTEGSGVAAPEEAASFRLLFVGDAVDGHGIVLPPQTYPRHVEWLIRTACRERADVQAVSTEDPVAEIRRRLPERPDRVVVEDTSGRALEEIADVERESGVRMLVLRWPKLDSPEDEAREKLRAVTVLDLLDIFRGRDPRRLQSIPGRDPRANEIAHRMAGEAVFDWLRKNEAWVAARIVEPRIHPNPPHWRRWRELETGRLSSSPQHSPQNSVPAGLPRLPNTR